MRKVVILLLYSIVLGNCGLSSLPTPTTPVFTKLSDDTTSVPTIVLSKPDTIIKEAVQGVQPKLPIKISSDTDSSLTVSIKIYPKHFSVEDFDGEVIHQAEVRQLTIEIDEDEITYLRVNGHVYEGAVVKKISAPTKLLKNGDILVNKGANLRYISRYYNIDIEKLKVYNNIKNIDHIEAGTILKTSCHCNDTKKAK